MRNKEETVRELAKKHYEIEPGITRIFTICEEAENEALSSTPIKLLEVNTSTVASGVMPLHFGPAPASGIPYPSVIIEVTPDEFERIKGKELKLPDGWIIGRELLRGERGLMATQAEWAKGYARQADADFRTFMTLQPFSIPDCHKLQFLQMACEKLVKGHLCEEGTDPVNLQTSHAYVATTLPVVLRQQAVFVGFSGPSAREVLKRAKHLSQEIHLLAPAVKRGGKRPDNCEYPWEDDNGKLHIPLDWSFHPSQLLLVPSGRAFLKLARGAIDRSLQ